MSQAVEAFRNAFKVPELKQRIIFTLVMIGVYRIGANVPTPGIDGHALSQIMGDGGLLAMYNLFSGGAFEQASIFALGIMPYISASIIMQLLVPVIPALERIQKEGADGHKKINEWTRYAAIGLAVFQSLAMAFLLESMSNEASEPFVMNPGLGFYFMCILSFTTGTAFIMWLGEQITEHGIGNGMSLVIFISIAAGVPGALFKIRDLFGLGEMDVIKLAILIASLVGVVAGAILVTTAQRRIPVQYPRQVKGKKVFAGASNYLPLRIVHAGVIPIIFASSILMLPSMVAQGVGGPVADFFQVYFAHDTFTYNFVFVVFIIFFSYFYTALTFNPIETADNLKKYGGVIVGVRPGKQTAEYLNKVMMRITFVGSLFLAAVALLPQIVYSFLGVYDFSIAQYFGGTSLLILVGVALDTIRQVDTHLRMRDYEGFMRGRRVRGRRSY